MVQVLRSPRNSMSAPELCSMPTHAQDSNPPARSSSTPEAGTACVRRRKRSQRFGRPRAPFGAFFTANRHFMDDSSRVARRGWHLRRRCPEDLRGRPQASHRPRANATGDRSGPKGVRRNGAGRTTSSRLVRGPSSSTPGVTAGYRQHGVVAHYEEPLTSAATSRPGPRRGSA